MQLGALFLAPLFSGGGLLKLGFLAASTVGSMLMNGSKEPSGKLNDLKVSTSTYGRGIPLAWGTVRVTGNMFWATDFEQSIKWVGGKKGSDKKKKGAQPVYVYHANYAMALCEGPVSRVLRVWADGNLIYDPFNRRKLDDDYTDDDKVVGPGFSSQQAGGSKKDSMKGADNGGGTFNFRFYPGTENQLQDPFMVKKQTADNVPAFRGMSYLFFEHFPLQDFGNRTPTITAEVEVFNDLSYNAAGFHEYENLAAPINWWRPSGGIYKDLTSEKVYVPASYRDETFALKYCLRVFDSVTRKEIERIDYSSIVGVCPWKNGPEETKTVNGVSRFCGISGDGYLIFDLPEGNNASPIVWVAPGSYVPVFVWGHASNWGDSDTAIAHPQSCQPLSVIVDDKNASGDVIQAMRSFTAMSTFFGGIHIFEGFESRKQIYLDGYYATITPGYGTFAGGFFATTNSVSGTKDLYYVSFDLFLESTVRHIYHHYDSIYGAIYGPFVLGGLDKFGILESRYSDIEPSKTGTFAVIFNKDFEKESEFKLTEDYNVILDSTHGMQPTPVINPGFHCFYVGGKHRKLIINWEDGTFEYFDMTASVAPDLWQGQLASLNGDVLFGGTHLDNGFHLYEMWQSSETINRQTVANIVRDMALRVGLKDEQINTDELKNSYVTGFLLENPTSARQVVEDLTKVFFFDVVESDNQLKFISRGRDSMALVTQDHLGVVGSEENGSYYAEKRNQEIDMPAFVGVSFINARKKYETNTQFWKRPHSPMPVLQSKDKLDINLPMVLTPEDAIRIAQNVLYSAWSERITHQFKLDWSFMLLDAADVVTFQMDDGLTFIERILKADLGADYSIELDTMDQDGATYNSTFPITYSPSGVSTNPVYPHPVVDVEVLDIPFLKDTEVISNGNFLYRLTALPRSRGFRYAGFADNASGTWDEVDDTYYPTIWGYIAGLEEPPHGPFVTDDRTEIIFAPGFDIEAEGNYEFSSIDDANWPSDSNTLIIGGEVIYFKTVTPNDNGSFTLSTLIRGARGTEAACYTHKPGEKGIIFTKAVKSELESFSTIGKEIKFRAFSASTVQALAPFDTIKFNANSHRPWAPVNFRRTDNVDNSVTISWCRRTRYGGSMQDGTDVVPINEETLAFEAYILADTYTNAFDPTDAGQYLLKLTPTSENFTLTSTQVTTLGLTDMVHVVVYQISTAVGRGFPGYADLPRLLGS